MKSIPKQPDSSFLFKGQKKEFLDWLESLRISKYWLDTLNHADSYALCKEIFQILQNFKQLDLVEKEKIFSLAEINSCLHAIYDRLHIIYFNAKFPLNNEQQESVEMIVSTYMALATAYYDVISDKTNKLSEQTVVLNSARALQALGVVFFTVSEVYVAPPKDFWLLCYRFFSISEEQNLLDNKVKIDNGIYSVALLFKQLLIFHILDKNLLPAKEIRTLFNLLIKGINYMQSYILAMVDIGVETNKGIIGFLLDKDIPPAPQNHISLATARILRYVEILEVIKIIQFFLHEAKEHPKSISVSSESLSRLLCSLDYQKLKRHTRINKQYGCCAIVGVDHLVEFLMEKEGKKASLAQLKPLKDYEFEDEIDNLQIISDWDSDQETNENNLMIEGLQIINSSINGYGISWNKKIKGKLEIGDVIGIMPDFGLTTKKIELGLIRRLEVLGETLTLGIEIIGPESTLIYIERESQANSGEWVLFLFGSPNYDVGLLCHKQHHYQSGESICVRVAENKIPCRLGAVLNSTPLIDHLALSY